MLDSKKRRILVKDINPCITCVLCHGYFIEPATIVECLHSFCRSCLVKYLELNKFCPICDVQLNKTNPLMSVRCDQTLQRLVYKLVPGLYSDEMSRRRKYYNELNENDDDTYPVQNQYFSPDDSISLSMEYTSDENGDEENNDPTHPEKQQLLHRRYLQCPAAVNVSHLKKFIKMKYELKPTFMVDIIYDGECLVDDFSLIDVAYTFNWNRTSPMKFKYRIRGKAVSRMSKPKKAITAEENHAIPSQRKQGLATLIRQQEQEPAIRPVHAGETLFTKKLDLTIDAKQQKKIDDNVKEITRKDRKRDRPVEDFQEDEPKKIKDEVKKPRENEIRKGEKSVEIRDNIRELMAKSNMNPIVRIEKKKLPQDIELEPERKRSRSDSHVLDEDHDADDEDDERAIMIDEPVVERKEHSSKKSDRKDKKKSKKQKHHHHHHHRHHDKKKDSPPAATIVSGDDIMKLKVKLTAIKSDTNSKVTKYSVVEDFDDRKDSSSAKSSPQRIDKKEEQKEKIKSSPKHEETKKDDPPPVKAIISLTNNKVVTNTQVSKPAPRLSATIPISSTPTTPTATVATSQQNKPRLTATVPVSSVPPTSQTVTSTESKPTITSPAVKEQDKSKPVTPINSVKPTNSIATKPPTAPIKPMPAAKSVPAATPINNNTISDKQSAVNVYENNKLSLSRKLLGQSADSSNQNKVSTQNKILPQNKVPPQPTKVQPQLTKVQPQLTKVQPQTSKVQPQTTKVQPQVQIMKPTNNMNPVKVNTVNNNNVNATNNNASNVTVKTTPAESASSSSSPPPLKPKTESVKLITGEAAKEKLKQMRAIRHKMMAQPVSESTTLKMPPSSITVSKITAEEKRQMEQAKILAAKQAAEDESKRPSLEIMLVNGPPGKDKDKEKEKEKDKEKEKEKEEPKAQSPAPTQPKKTVRPTPPSIPLSQLNKTGRWPPKPLMAAQEVLDLSGKSSRKSPDVGGSSDQTQTMRNLMTLSDTAVQIRNIMQESEVSIPMVGGKPAAFTPQPQQRQVVKPNQNVRHIPNPSVLAFRYNGTPVPPPPVLPLRKMESMTRSIEKVAAGLGLKAAYAAK